MAADFTYQYYADLVTLLRDKGFTFDKFMQGSAATKRVFLRHDIDMSIRDAIRFAEMEARLGVVSTYYVMLDTELYSVLCSAAKNDLRGIANLGHDIGLHYVQHDQQFDSSKQSVIADEIRQQSKILSDVLGIAVGSFSYHRPNSEILNANVAVENLCNAYSAPFFTPGAYISDSNHHWRCGDPTVFIRNYVGTTLQILTHPFWWGSSAEDPVSKLKRFLQERSDRNKAALIHDVKLASSAFAEGE